MNKLINFWNDEEGATAIEYGIIAGLMAVVLVAIFGGGTDSFVTKLKSTFSYIGEQLPTGTAGGSTP
ncbi:Flp family type IVb pilin [Xenophilus sp.]|uniref:Flp family type IVb pilin n=1 Tax=Xenophilus sp. TaxID=1873499 RepID=UPI0037DCEE2D